MKNEFLRGVIALAAITTLSAQWAVPGNPPDRDRQPISRGLTLDPGKTLLPRVSLRLGHSWPARTNAGRVVLARPPGLGMAAPAWHEIAFNATPARGLNPIPPEVASLFLPFGSPTFAEGEYRALISFIEGAATRARAERESRRWALGTYAVAVGLCALAFLAFLSGARRPVERPENGSGRPLAT